SLLIHVQSADGAKPTKKWLARAHELVEELGRDRFRTYVSTWLPLTAAHCTTRRAAATAYHADENLLFSDVSHVTLKGLAWTGSLFFEADVSAALGDLGETCWRKVPNYGPRSKLAGNAALW